MGNRQASIYTGGNRVTPGFTAEAALMTYSQPYYTRAKAPMRVQGGIYPQQRETAAQLTPPTVCTCPCCQVHDCGFLGLWDCVTCC